MSGSVDEDLPALSPTPLVFDVKVVSVNTSMRPLKRRRVGKFIGQKPRHKRAIVTLAPENSITFFEEN